MEVRIGELNIAQHRNLEGHAVLIATGNGLDAFGSVRGLIGTYNAHLLEGLTAQLSAVVADRAAGLLKDLIAVQFLLSDGVFVALEPLVKTSVGRDESTFEFGHGFGDALDVDFSVAESLLEVRSVAGDRSDDLHGHFVGGGHFKRIGNGAGCLFGKRLGAAVPELSDLTEGVQYGRRIDRPLCPAIADGGLQIVHAARREVVAAVAGNEAGTGQTGLEKEHFAELDQSRIFDFDRFNRINGFGGLNGGAQRHYGAGDGAAKSKFFHRSLLYLRRLLAVEKVSQTG